MSDTKNISKKNLQSYVIKIRQKAKKIQEEQFFCQNHKFDTEASVKRSQAELLNTLAIDLEREFDLGFCWDESIN